MDKDNSVEAGGVLYESDEVDFVMDSVAGDMFVADSQVEFSELRSTPIML